MSLELVDTIPIAIAIVFAVALTLYMNRKPSQQ